MEIHENNTQLTIPSCRIVPANRVLLHRRDASAAGRYALKRNKRAESAEKWAKEVRLTNRLYDLNTLTPEYIEKFIAHLEDLDINYTIL